MLSCQEMNVGYKRNHDDFWHKCKTYLQEDIETSMDQHSLGTQCISVCDILGKSQKPMSGGS